ncbi:MULTISPECIES: hypothetical protein [Streptomycetaceae]|uniref:hypothetical protein n=1 Tax=Streptomycetaceae TaxID=2062 RepID=UPI00037D3B8B|nr:MULTISPECIES: hypothetical protein [Streptomycetaceae]MYX32350.1 hypothetical protein [Streptomyces sp. SID8377]
MTWKRFAVPALLGIAVCGTLTGCTVPVAGTTGIAVSEDGRPLGVIVVCHDHIDGATLYDSDADDASARLGRWSRAKPATGFTVWSLESGGRGWRAEVAASAPFAPHRTYSLYGWTRDNSSSTAHVRFTAAQFASLEPGQVRWYKGMGEPGTDGDGNATTSMGEFRADACEGM